MLEGRTVMARYYAQAALVTPAEAVDRHTEALADGLSEEPNLIDPDIGANLRDGWVYVCALVDGEDEASALATGLVAIRSAVHHAEAASPGWEADVDRVKATVRSPELVDA